MTIQITYLSTLYGSNQLRLAKVYHTFLSFAISTYEHDTSFKKTPYHCMHRINLSSSDFYE